MRNPFARREAPALRVEPRLAPSPKLEQRDALGGAGLSFGTFLGGGGEAAITPHGAENVGAVAACVNAISSALASLPLRAYRNTPAGRIELPESHWLPVLLKAPSPQNTGPELVEFMLSSALLSGNALATISYDRDGQPTELNPVPWQCATPVLTSSGKLAFNVSQRFGPFEGAGTFRRYLATETLYLKDRSDNGGWTGRSRLSRSPGVLAAALGIQAYSASVWENSAAPEGQIIHPGALSPEAVTFILNSWNEAHRGPQQAKKTALFMEGMRWEPIAVSPEDAEVLESRKFTVPEICRLFQVPPPIIQSFENNAFTSSETANRWFASMSLAPWARKLEAAISKALLGDEPELHVEFDMTGLVRGDFAARWASYATARQNGILTVSEIRSMEGYSPLPDTLGEIVPGAAST